ncbi:hypothetical protein [Vagococcus sp. CY52-2]|uniref:hypothetical protein n=1 Tax=Vagococcus sp. CY52-2 TaxID=2925838 RepID=UPI001F5717B4|nr:hypothetical protein [Vagococcus sp. CY52-2]UNM90337.1 hypothetical protein MN187_04425 [Vagococcus sp. CY52-2]
MIDREKRVNEGLEARKKFNSLEVDYKLETERIYRIVQNHPNKFVTSKSIFVITLGSNKDFKLKYKQYFKSLSKNDLESYYYVWIGLSEGNVVVVGRTSFSKNARSSFGDLFNEYNIFGGITQEIIMRIIISEKKGIDVNKINQLNNDLNDFFTHAIIVPVDVGQCNKKEADLICSTVEQQLGDGLIKNEIEILNTYSHKFY